MARWMPVAALALASCGPGLNAPPPRTHVVVVVDGLRPDYVTPELMPRLSDVGRRGVIFTAHHAVFPTVTRVNAPSIATGAYPETHGLMGNAVYIPAVDATKSLDTSARENLEAIDREGGPLLTARSLGEILQEAGLTLLAVSAGSSGSAFLLNHRLGNGGIIHIEYARPAELRARVAERLGPPPAADASSAERNRWAVDAYLTIGLEEIRPDVTLMWLTDPDTTAHTQGIGATLTLEALAAVDSEIGRLEDTLRSKGMLDRTNLIVTSDHGFSTHTGEFHLTRLLEPFVRRLDDGSPDIVTAGGAIYLRAAGDATRVGQIVAALQRQPEVGAIFSRSGPRGGPQGSVPGTLAFEVARWAHARAGDILVSANWTRAANEAGYEGQTTQGGVAGHGTSGPSDIHSTLIAAGPGFREATISGVPTGNVDLAPTLLHLAGMAVPPDMTGRVIEEALRDGPLPSSLRVDRVAETVKTPDGTYELTAHISIVAGHRYLDYTEVRRR